MTRASALVFTALFAISIANRPLAAQSSTKPLTVDAIFAHGSVIGHPPDQPTWSPDGTHLTYLEGGELMDVDPATGKARVLVSHSKMAMLEKPGGSETDRDNRLRYHIASYLWAPDSTSLLFDTDGQIWIYNLHDGTGRLAGISGLGSGDDPKFSPDGASISFIHNQSLAVVRVRNAGTPMTILAPSSSPSILNGSVDWVYQEELDTHSNYFWSPDSRRLAYLQMDETKVPQYPLTDWLTTHASVQPQYYPQPGDPNPNVRVGVVSAGGGKTVWVQLPIAPGQDYIPRFGWADSRTLWIEALSRDQKHRTVYLADADNGQAHRALEISDDKFVKEDFDLFAGAGSLVLSDWSSGHNQLYLYSYDPANPAAPAKLERQLTSGDFEVGDVYNVDVHAKLIDYASNQDNPLGQQLWQVGFDGKRTELSTGAGFHEGIFAPKGGAFVDQQSSFIEPPTVRVCTAAGNCSVLWQTHALDSYRLRTPEQLKVKAHDGTILYATLLMPATATRPATRPASVPLIVNPYGGPGVQSLLDEWGGGDMLFDELLAEHGFAVLHTDNRGMAGRGRAFEQACYHDFGPVQLEDQLTALDFVLAKYPQLDQKRLGWWGWSWGGTFTLYAMTHSTRFRAGIAVAPVTNWLNYDSIYTERYMGLPAENPGGYHDDSVVNSAANLKGRLLLAIGTSDDNVHIENTVQFVQRLIEARQPYDLQIYPGKTHSIYGDDVRTHLFDRILAHFEQYLTPPVE